jgi:hypothetical protein
MVLFVSRATHKLSVASIGSIPSTLRVLRVEESQVHTMYIVYNHGIVHMSRAFRMIVVTVRVLSVLLMLRVLCGMYDLGVDRVIAIASLRESGELDKHGARIEEALPGVWEVQCSRIECEVTNSSTIFSSGVGSCVLLDIRVYLSLPSLQFDEVMVQSAFEVDESSLVLCSRLHVT